MVPAYFGFIATVGIVVKENILLVRNLLRSNIMFYLHLPGYGPLQRRFRWQLK